MRGSVQASLTEIAPEATSLSGGAGADTFHFFAGAGIDRVTDFSAAQGDHVLLDHGTLFTVRQTGAEVVIETSGGGQMILANVQLSSLPEGWISG